MSASVLASLHAIVDDLVGAGVPRPSDYWLNEARRFYTHATAKLLVQCVGRGGDKTRFSVMMGIAETLTGDFRIPLGERHYYVHISENKDEASKTLNLFEQYLRVLHVPFHRAGDTVDLDAMPRGFKILAARIGAVSGWRCTGWCADEAAKWSDDGSDPSEEIIVSVRAMTITHENARGRMVSSPVAAGGYFHDCWAQGDTAHQLAGHAASWIANPSISEERTRELEVDDRVRAREYGAVASAGSSDALDPADIAAMVRPLGRSTGLGSPVMLIDSSSGRNDGWSFARAAYVREGGRRVLLVDHLGAFEGAFQAEGVSFDAVVHHVAQLARHLGAFRIYGDQYQSFPLASGFMKYGLAHVERSWSQPSKIEALSTLRRLLKERSIVIEPGEEAEKLRKELATLREVLLPSKVFTVQARRSGRGHSNRASLLLLLARLVSEGDIAAGGVGGDSPGSSGAPAGMNPSRFRPIATQFGVGRGLSTRFEKQDFVSPMDNGARPDGPQRVAWKNPATGETHVHEVPAPPSFGQQPGGGGGGRGWGGGGRGGWGGGGFGV